MRREARAISQKDAPAHSGRRSRRRGHSRGATARTPRCKHPFIRQTVTDTARRHGLRHRCDQTASTIPKSPAFLVGARCASSGKSASNCTRNRFIQNIRWAQARGTRTAEQSKTAHRRRRESNEGKQRKHLSEQPSTERTTQHKSQVHGAVGRTRTCSTRCRSASRWCRASLRTVDDTLISNEAPGSMYALRRTGLVSLFCSVLRRASVKETSGGEGRQAAAAGTNQGRQRPLNRSKQQHRQR